MSNANARDSNGDSIIPASQRPDGTWRKARRVKEGYVPQEEVPLYESKGKQIVTSRTNRQQVVLPSGHIAHESIPGLYVLSDPKKSKSKKKSKTNVEDVTKRIEQINVTEPVKKKANPTQKKSEVVSQKATETIEANNASIDPVKRLKNLKKRLREVEALEEKLNNGQIPKPEPEQLTKIKRKNDLLYEIRELEKVI